MGELSICEWKLVGWVGGGETFFFFFFFAKKSSTLFCFLPKFSVLSCNEVEIQNKKKIYTIMLSLYHHVFLMFQKTEG